MTMRMGKSFVEDETSRAVETEFGRGVVGGRREKRRRGERGEVVRMRMARWKESVESVQRITVREH